MPYETQRLVYKPLQAGELRHRITVQKLGVVSQDPETGETSRAWVNFLVDEPASIQPLSVRDYIASQANTSVVVARIKIRYRDGMSANMRILHGAKIYNPQGWLPDPYTGREYLTAPCTEGANEGQ
jgi:SPP1 family predicted phage head-tail adaptor